MRFEINIPPSVVFQESIPINIRIENIGYDKFIPADYNSSDVLTLFLLNEDREIIRQLNGYEKLERLAVPVEKQPQTQMKTVPFKSRQIMQWKEDLLSYMDFPLPGKYFIKAKFVFEPEKISLESPPHQIEILENRSEEIDILRDQVLMGMVYYLQQVQTKEDSKILLQFSNGSEVSNFWMGGSISFPVGANPKISETGLVGGEDFDPEFFRWFISADKDRLIASWLERFKASEEIFEYPLTKKIAHVFRPIQQKDKGVSILLLNKTENKSELVRLDFDFEFKNRGKHVLESFDYIPSLLTSASDWLGNNFIIIGNKNSLSTQLLIERQGKIVYKDILLSKEDFLSLEKNKENKIAYRILGATANVKSYSAGVRSILITVYFEDKDKKWFELVQIPVDREGKVSNQRNFQLVSIDEKLIKKNEKFLVSDIVQTKRKTVIATFSTSLGNLFYSVGGGYIQKAANIDPKRITELKLVSSLSEDVYLFFPTEKLGIGRKLIYDAPKR